MASSGKRIGRLKKYRIHSLIVLVLLAALVTAFWPAYIWNTQLDGQLSTLAKQRDQQVAENKALQEEVQRLNTPDYIEQLARRDLGLVKPGEIPLTPFKSTEPK